MKHSAPQRWPATLNRILRNAQRIALKGESLRKQRLQDESAPTCQPR